MRLGAVDWTGGSWRHVVGSSCSVKVFRAEGFTIRCAACHELIIGSSHVNETPGVPIKRPDGRCNIGSLGAECYGQGRGGTGIPGLW